MGNTRQYYQNDNRHTTLLFLQRDPTNRNIQEDPVPHHQKSQTAHQIYPLTLRTP